MEWGRGDKDTVMRSIHWGQEEEQTRSIPCTRKRKLRNQEHRQEGYANATRMQEDKRNPYVSKTHQICRTRNAQYP